MYVDMDRNHNVRAELARQIVLQFRDKASGGHADLGEDAWWVEDMLDRIQRAITPHLSDPTNMQSDARDAQNSSFRTTQLQARASSLM